MAHDHAHPHGDANSYYIEQLFTIAVCGAIGGVMMMMYFSGRVRYLFGNNEDQYMRVLLGGAGLVAVVLIRAVYVWFAVGAKAPAAHDHDHGDCGHDHGDCGHDHHHHEHEEGIKAGASAALTSLPLTPALATVPAHSHDHNHDHHHHDHDHHHGHDHDHDHGWAPWRFMLLLLPVILFFLGLPNQEIRGGVAVNLDAEGQLALDKMAAGEKGKGNAVVPMSFLQLEQAAMSRDVRDVQSGKTISITGIYLGNGPASFTLQRYKINCCAADAIPLNAVIAIHPEAQKKFKLDPEQYQGKWVNVTGRLQFFLNKDKYVSAIILDPDENTSLADLVKVVPPDPNPYAS